MEIDQTGMRMQILTRKIHEQLEGVVPDDLGVCIVLVERQGDKLFFLANAPEDQLRAALRTLLAQLDARATTPAGLFIPPGVKGT